MREDPLHIDLAWPEPIPPGGIFTIQFDTLIYPYGDEYFGFGLVQAVFPESATCSIARYGLAGWD